MKAFRILIVASGSRYRAGAAMKQADVRGDVEESTEIDDYTCV